MIFWLIAGFVTALALSPFVIRALRDLRGSPELRVTLRAAAIGIALEFVPLLVLIFKFRGPRRPR